MFRGRGLNRKLPFEVLESLRTPQEPDFRIEILAGEHVLGINAPPIGIPHEPVPGTEVVAGAPARLRLGDVMHELDVLVELQHRVDAVGVVDRAVRARSPPRANHADAAAPQDLALHAHGGEIGSDGVEGGHVAGAHLENADLVPAAPAEQASAADDRDDAAVLESDPAAEEDHRDLRVVTRRAALGAEAEELLPLHEELALLRILQREPRQVELLLVVFHLREVGVVGGVEDVADDGYVKVTAALNEHPPVVPSFAFRFDTADRSIVISGDTNVSKNLIRLAAGADVLVHEVMHVPSITETLERQKVASRLREHMFASHTTVDDVGRVAAAANVKTLVLSHFVPGDITLPDDEWTAGARTHFKGRVVVGADLMEI